MGLKINNPWNLKCYDLSNPWRGTIGYDDAGHVIFEHAVFASRAVCRDLAQKYAHSKRTIRQIMTAYSPANDALNDPDSAAVFICEQMNQRSHSHRYDPDADCGLFGDKGRPTCIHTLRNFLEILSVQESGWDEAMRVDPNAIMAGIHDYMEDFCHAEKNKF